MVSMVKCTQTGQLMPLDWQVKLPDEMRQRLYYPLTHDIVHTICTTKEKPQVSRFDYHCLSHAEYKNVISGEVTVDIDYVNVANGLDLHHHNVVLHIEWTFENGRGWYVSAVDKDASLQS